MKAIKEAIALLKFLKDRKNTRLTTMIKVQSCIAELEALQQPKSCDGCKFHEDVGWDDWCCDCIRKWTIDRYEAKEQ